jgi:hypothetical protein
LILIFTKIIKRTLPIRILITFKIQNENILQMKKIEIALICENRKIKVNFSEKSTNNFLCINEEIQSKMKFPILEKQSLKMPNGEIEEFKIATCVKLLLNDSQTFTDAIILKGSSQVSIGKFTLDKLDKTKTFSKSHHFPQRKVFKFPKLITHRL